MYTFMDMENWDLSTLRQVRKELRDKLAEEIHKRSAIKAEIMFLEREIKKMSDI